MNQKELSLEFITRIKNHNYEEFYKFFTKETVVYLIEEKKEIKVEELVNLLQSIDFASLEVKRVLESKICTKVETKLNDKEYNFYFDVKSRRIKRLELQIL